MFWEEKKRKPIPMKVKRQVYQRAKGRCEKCGTRLEMNEGDFHHIRDPTVTPRASTVRFLCPICHRKYGHKRITRKVETFFATEKKVKVIPQEVVKIRKRGKKKTGKTGQTYTCKLSVNERLLHCPTGSKKASKSCLKADVWTGKKCRYLIISRRK